MRDPRTKGVGSERSLDTPRRLIGGDPAVGDEPRVLLPGDDVPALHADARQAVNHIRRQRLRCGQLDAAETIRLQADLLIGTEQRSPGLLRRIGAHEPHHRVVDDLGQDLGVDAGVVAPDPRAASYGDFRPSGGGAGHGDRSRHGLLAIGAAVVWAATPACAPRRSRGWIRRCLALCLGPARCEGCRAPAQQCTGRPDEPAAGEPARARMPHRSSPYGLQAARSAPEMGSGAVS